MGSEAEAFGWFGPSIRLIGFLYPLIQRKMKLGAGEFLLVLILGVGSGRGDCDCRHLSELSDQVSELRSTLQIHAEWFRQQRSREEETIGRSTGAARRQNILLEQMKLLLANLNADVTRLRQSRLPQLEMRMSSIETEVVKRQEAGNPADETPGRSGRQSAALREMQESIDDLKDQTFMAKETLNVFGDIILARNRNDSAEAYQNLTADVECGGDNEPTGRRGSHRPRPQIAASGIHAQTDGIPTPTAAAAARRIQQTGSFHLRADESSSGQPQRQDDNIAPETSPATGIGSQNNHLLVDAGYTNPG